MVRRVVTPSILAKAVLDQPDQLEQRAVRAFAGYDDVDAVALGRAEHHQAEDRASGRIRAILEDRDRNAVAQLGDGIDELGTGPGVQPPVVDDFYAIACLGHRNPPFSLLSGVLAEELRSDGDVVAPRIARRDGGLGQVHAAARLGEADQHRQVDPCDHFDLAGFHQRNRQVGRRAPEQVGEDDDALTGIDRLDRVRNLAAAGFHVVVRADADSGYGFLAADDVLHRMFELLGKLAVGDQNDADHGDATFLCCGPVPVSYVGKSNPAAR